MNHPHAAEAERGSIGPAPTRRLGLEALVRRCRAKLKFQKTTESHQQASSSFRNHLVFNDVLPEFTLSSIFVIATTFRGRTGSA